MTENEFYECFNEFLLLQGEYSRFTKRLSEFLDIPESGLRFLIYLKIHGKAEDAMELGTYYGMIGPNIARSVKKLLAKNLIKRHKRKLSLTAYGNKIIDKMHDAMIAIQTTERPYEKFVSQREAERKVLNP